MIRTRLGIACGLALGLAAGSAAQSPYYAFEQIGVGTSAVGFTVGKIAATSGHPQALLASCRVETAEIRYTTDGTTPTASVGTLLEVGDVVTLSDTGQLARFQAIRTGGTSGQLDCFYSGSANGIVLAPAANVSATVSASNPAASATGAAVPAQASYTGINVGGNTTGWTGFSLGTARAGAMAIVDGSGNQITSFGGGTQYTNGSAQATPTGTMALGFDGANVRALATDTSGHLAVNFAATPTINSAQSGTWNFRLQDGSGNAIGSNANGGTTRAIAAVIYDGAGNPITSFSGSGGTASNFGSAFPSAGTAIGFKDSTGTNMAAGNLDASGNLKVNIAAVTSPDTQLTYNTAPTLTGATGGITFGFASASAPTAVTSGTPTLPWLDLNGRQHVIADSGAISDGANVTLGAKADAKSTATDTTAVTAMQVLKEISAMEQAPASRAVTNAGTFPTQAQPTAVTSGGATPGFYISAATNNSTNLKASAGQLYYLTAINSTATEKFIRLYDLATAPTCTSATGVVFYSPIPANSTTGAGFVLPIPVGMQFSSGIGWCITGAAGTTDNTSTAAGDVVINYGSK